MTRAHAQRPAGGAGEVTLAVGFRNLGSFSTAEAAADRADVTAL